MYLLMATMPRDIFINNNDNNNNHKKGSLINLII